MRTRGGKEHRRQLAGVLAVGIAALMSAHAAAAPPRIVAITPSPADWTVDGTALHQVMVQFDSPVIVPHGAVVARTLSAGEIAPVVVTPLISLTTSITISFPPVFEDRLTLIVDHTVVNALGEALDGEVSTPRDSVPPTGDGNQGGNAVFQFSVLQGDVNRDGVVDSLDFTLLRAAMLNYNAHADLNHDGVINSTDEAILLAGGGGAIPVTDKISPTIVDVAPETVPLPGEAIVVTFSESMDLTTLTRRSLHLVGENGQFLTPSAEPTTADGVRFFFPFDSIACSRNYDVFVSNAVADVRGELLTPAAPHLLGGTDTTPPVIDCPFIGYVNSTTPYGIAAGDIATHGVVQEFLRSAVAADECADGAGDVRITASLDQAVVNVPLGVNTVTFTATDEAGNAASCAAILIVVQAVPLPGEPGSPGVAGPPGPDGLPGDAGADGLAGADGAAGTACWDLNGNGVEDIIEDRNDDGLVNVLDCQGLEGEPGEDGEDGAPGPAGSHGTGRTPRPGG